MVGNDLAVIDHSGGVFGDRVEPDPNIICLCVGALRVRRAERVFVPQLRMHRERRQERTRIDLGDFCEMSHGYGLTNRSEEHTSELPSLIRSSYAVFCLKKKKNNTHIK